MWNNSRSPYLICYQKPTKIEKYGFLVRNICVVKALKMYGSNETHTGYIYQRIESISDYDRCTNESKTEDPFYSEMRKLSLPSESFETAISQQLESYWNNNWLRSGKNKTTITKKKRKHKERNEVTSNVIAADISV
jgi:hypothetical protein